MKIEKQFKNEKSSVSSCKRYLKDNKRESYQKFKKQPASMASFSF